MLHCLTLLMLAWLAALFDCGLAALVEVRGCAPSACLLAAAIAIARCSNTSGLRVAAWFGLAADLCGGGRLGASMACFALVAFVAIRLRTSPAVRPPLGQAVELLFVMLAAPVGAAALQRLASGTEGAWPTLLLHALAVGSYTAVCAAPILLAMSWTSACTRPHPIGSS
jgi:cell shape-determining protein MreD